MALGRRMRILAGAQILDGLATESRARELLNIQRTATAGNDYAEGFRTFIGPKHGQHTWR